MVDAPIGDTEPLLGPTAGPGRRSNTPPCLERYPCSRVVAAQGAVVHQPDAALLDLSLERLTAPGLIGSIPQGVPGPRKVVLASLRDSNAMRSCSWE